MKKKYLLFLISTHLWTFILSTSLSNSSREVINTINTTNTNVSTDNLTLSLSSYGCPYGCSYCYDTDCVECFGGYSLVNGNCVYCSVLDCETCSSSSYCSQCYEGYYSYYGICYSCPSGCTTCYQDYCYSCYSGYTLIDGICDYENEEDCSEYCEQCYYGTCYSCESGYRLNSNGECINNTDLIIGVVIGSICFVFVLICIGACICKGRTKTTKPIQPKKPHIKKVVVNNTVPAQVVANPILVQPQYIPPQPQYAPPQFYQDVQPQPPVYQSQPYPNFNKQFSNQYNNQLNYPNVFGAYNPNYYPNDNMEKTNQGFAPSSQFGHS